MFASGVDRGSRIGCAVAVLLLVALSAITPEAIAGTPLVNRLLGAIRGTATCAGSPDFDSRRHVLPPTMR